MILKRIKLSNIRSYTEEEVVFPQGSTLLSGDIGAGKSTILMAVEFALFGIMRAELSGSSLLRNGQNSGFIELDFEIENKNVRVRRNLKRSRDAVKQDAGFVVINGIQSDLTPQEIKARIIELVGYPEDMLTSAKSLIFRYTVYTPQEEMKRIVFEEPKERLNSLRKIFGIDKYKTISSNAEIFSRKLWERKKILSEKITDLGQREEQKQKEKKELDDFRKGLDELMPRLKSAGEQLEEKKSEKEKLEQEAEKFRKIKSALEITRAKIEEKTGSLKRVDSDIEELNESLRRLEEKSTEFKTRESAEQLENELKEREKEYGEKLQKISALKSKKAEMENNAKLLREELEDFEKKMKQAEERRKNLEELRESIAEKEKFQEKLGKNAEEIMRLKSWIAAKEAWEKTASELSKEIDSVSNCPLCHQPIFSGQKENIRQEQEQRARELREEIKNSDIKRASVEEEQQEIQERIKKLSEMEKESERLSGALENSGFLEQTYRERKERLGKIDADLAETARQIGETDTESLNQQIRNKREILQRVRDAENMANNIKEKKAGREKLENYREEIKKEIEEIKSKNADLENKAKEFEGLEERLSLSSKKSEELNETVKNLELQKLSFEKDIENRRKSLQNLEEEIAEKRKIKSEIQKISDKREWIKDKLVPFVHLVENHIMQKVHEEFDSHFKQWASTLLEDESMNARLEEDFTPKVEQNGYEMGIADLSGGERTSFALAYRLALNKVINDVLSAIKTKQLLILDEPTDGFSSEQLDKMRDVLEQLNVDQTIIVSHEPKLESFVQNIIRVEKSHSASRVLA